MPFGRVLERFSILWIKWSLTTAASYFSASTGRRALRLEWEKRGRGKYWISFWSYYWQTRGEWEPQRYTIVNHKIWEGTSHSVSTRSILHRVLRPIWVSVSRVLHRVQVLDRLVAATVCYLLRKDFSVGVEPLMTILMPVFNTAPEILRKSIQSVLSQNYRKWELCIVDDASSMPHIRHIVSNIEYRGFYVCIHRVHCHAIGYLLRTNIITNASSACRTILKSILRFTPAWPFSAILL